MKWTKDKPTESGYYWAMEDEDFEPEVVEFINSDTIYCTSDMCVQDENSFLLFAGPIPLPEEEE